MAFKIIEGVEISYLSKTFARAILLGGQTFETTPNDDTFKLDVATYLVSIGRSDLVTDESYLQRATARIEEAKNPTVETEQEQDTTTE